MDRFAQWLRRQGNRQEPTSFIVLGVVGTIVPFQGMLFGIVPSTPPAIVAGIAFAALSWTPMAVRRYRTRHELWIGAKGIAGSVRGWREKTASHAEDLEAAAIDLEQIETLAGKTALDAREAASLSRFAEARLRRMFELTVAAPARHGLTLGQAEATIAEDARWIAEARRLVERTLETVEPQELGASLADLRALADAREAAVAELNA